MHLETMLVAGVPILAIIPALVESMKRAGLPDRYAGLAAIANGIVLFALADLATNPNAVHLANWLLGGIVYGLAAAGLYSQTRKLLT